jgi:hypothetical protein
VHDVGDGDAALSLADLAQWMASKVMAPAFAPPIKIIGTASSIAALSTAFGMEFGMLAPTVLRHGAGCWRR